MQEQERRDSANGPGDPVRDQGDAEAALASAARVFTREYYQPHLAHAPMEPPAALASFKDGKCEVWSCLQSPYGARVDIADFLGQIGRAHVRTPVTNAHLVCRLMLDKKNKHTSTTQLDTYTSSTHNTTH